jgi:zinc transporter ZupT
MKNLIRFITTAVVIAMLLDGPMITAAQAATPQTQTIHQIGTARATGIGVGMAISFANTIHSTAMLTSVYSFANAKQAACQVLYYAALSSGTIVRYAIIGAMEQMGCI